MRSTSLSNLKAKLEDIHQDPVSHYERIDTGQGGKIKFNPMSVRPNLELAIKAIEEAEIALDRVPRPDK